MIKFLLNLFVKNFRMGLATNSSSSHSLVYFATPRPGHPAGSGTVEDGWDDDGPSHSSGGFYRAPGSVDTEFGWNQFRLSTMYEKLMYALVRALQVEGYSHWYSYGDKPQPDLNEAYAKLSPMFPELEREDYDEAANGYIDHQSQDSVERLLEAARNPFVEVWGGNDNGGDPHDGYMSYNKSWDKELDPKAAPDGIVKVEYLG